MGDQAGTSELRLTCGPDVVATAADGVLLDRRTPVEDLGAARRRERGRKQRGSGWCECPETMPKTKKPGDDAESTLPVARHPRRQRKSGFSRRRRGGNCDDSLANFHFPVIGKISNGPSQSTRPYHMYIPATVYQSDGQLRVVRERRGGKENEGGGGDGQYESWARSEAVVLCVDGPRRYIHSQPCCCSVSDAHRSCQKG